MIIITFINQVLTIKSHNIQLVNYFTIFFFALCLSILFLYRIYSVGIKSLLYFGDKLESESNYKKAENIRMIQVILGFSFFVFHSVLFFGVLNTVIFFIISFTTSLFLEIIGANKGYVFGKYSYEPSLCPGPMLGNVPLLIAIAWSGLIYMSLNCSFLILDMGFNSIISLEVIIMTSIFITILDLILDPIAVSEGRWRWDKPGNYYGVPIQNFIGWFFNTTIILVFFKLLSSKHMISESHPFYVTFAPGLLFICLPVIAARPCFERKLYFAGYIGILFTVFLSAAFIL